VTQAGGTTTLELTALGRPFIYIPIEGHCEQMGPVSDRLRRHGAGVRMSYRDTTPAQLADRIVEGLASVPAVPNVPFDGARRVAQIAVEALRAARTGTAATAPA
jgi:UDP-N-acetylglucosamine:LPS N-acetylglucosamine transferase